MHGSIVVQDGQRSQAPVPMWLWPPTWINDTIPADGLDQCLTALEVGATKLAAITNGAIRELQATEIRGVQGSVGAGEFTRSTDKMVFMMLTEQGHQRRLEVGCAPMDAVLDADGQTILLENALIQAIITAIVDAGLCDTSGNNYTACLRAFRDSSGAKGKKPGGR